MFFNGIVFLYNKSNKNIYTKKRKALPALYLLFMLTDYLLACCEVFLFVIFPRSFR